MLTLAGLQRIEYVLVSPPTEGSQVGDLVLAGPAGDWFVQPSGRIAALETGRPIVRLDDLLVLLRRYQTTKRASFGCSITPRREALAATQEYLRKTGKRPLELGGRKQWLTGLRDTLGKQDVEYFGIDPQTRVARVLLAADYHMKLIDTEGLAERAGWQPGLLLDFQRLRLPAVATPGHVETVINHRVLRGRHVLAGVSGGVWVDAGKTLRVREGELANERALSRSRAKAPAGSEDATWWWD